MRVPKPKPASIGAVPRTPRTAPVAVADRPLEGGAVPGLPRPRFAALDFETADYGRDSACALSIVLVENDAIIDTWTRLIRPPRPGFVFTYLHGITWANVKNKPSFGDLWGEITNRLEGVDFVAAHNASFDRSVLQACCAAAAVPPVTLPFICTVRAARSIWGFYPTTLADVCRQLRIPLRHHDAESDAQACARILLAARQRGHAYNHLLEMCALKGRSASGRRAREGLPARGAH